MWSDRTDRELLRAFAANGEEAAFRELMGRYSDLVFGTAQRVVRERTVAEEVTQNVFVALARKAAFLPADTCLGAWLHKSAVLEAKNWVRGEVRRKRREELSGGLIMNEHESILQSLTMVLDEALLDLREQDRAALLLRYVQDRSLKEVGSSLGVNEDTAQKRVSKAVDLLTRAFRRRGYSVPGVALTVAVLEGAAQAAPAGLVTSAAATALSAAVPATSLSGTTLVLAKFMALTKTQTATVCVLLASAPIAYQWQLTQEGQAEQTVMARRVEHLGGVLGDLDLQNAAKRRDLMMGENEMLGIQAEIRRLSRVPAPSLPPDEELYAWSDDSDYVRLPKDVLKNLRLTSADPEAKRGPVLDKDGNVSPVLLEALGLDANQIADVQGAFMNFAMDFNSLVEARTYVTNATPPGVGFSRPPGTEIITRRTPSFPEEGAELRSRLKAALETSIGPERTEILMEKQAGQDFSNEFLEFGKYDKWVATAPQQGGMFTVAQSKTLNGTSYGGRVWTVPHEGLPEEFRQYFPAPKEDEP